MLHAFNVLFTIENNLANCEQCSSYKIQLNELREKINDADKRLQTMEKLKDEHDKETVYRKEMEEKWNEKLEEHKNKVIIINIHYNFRCNINNFNDIL